MISDTMIQSCYVCNRMILTICDGCGRYICDRHTFIRDSEYDGGFEEEYCPQCIVTYGLEGKTRRYGGMT